MLKNQIIKTKYCSLIHLNYQHQEVFRCQKNVIFFRNLTSFFTFYIYNIIPKPRETNFSGIFQLSTFIR